MTNWEQISDSKTIKRWKKTDEEIYMTVSKQVQYSEPEDWWWARVTVNDTSSEVGIGKKTKGDEAKNIAISWAESWMENQPNVTVSELLS